MFSCQVKLCQRAELAFYPFWLRPCQTLCMTQKLFISINLELIINGKFNLHFCFSV